MCKLVIRDFFKIKDAFPAIWGLHNVDIYALHMHSFFSFVFIQRFRKDNFSG